MVKNLLARYQALKKELFVFSQKVSPALVWVVAETQRGSGTYTRSGELEALLQKEQVRLVLMQAKKRQSLLEKFTNLQQGFKNHGLRPSTTLVQKAAHLKVGNTISVNAFEDLLLKEQKRLFSLTYAIDLA